MSDEAWTVLGLVVTLVVAPLVAVFVLWLRKRLRLVELSDEAATAVRMATQTEELPKDLSAALVFLARQSAQQDLKIAQQDLQIRELMLRDNAWAMFTWELEHWGLRGWSRAPKPHDPMPQRPLRLRPDPTEMPSQPLPETEEG